MVKELNNRDVVRMCQHGEAKKARRTLKRLLSVSVPGSKAKQKRLLDDLFYVEVNEGRLNAALEVLKRRRALGFRNSGQRMDAVFETCGLLYKASHIFEARAELIRLLRDRRSLDWNGLLSALSLFVEVDEKCRELMNSVLSEASGVAIRKLGFPTSIGRMATDAPQMIRAADSMFRADSKLYSELLCRVFTESTQEGRGRVIGDLLEFSEGAGVEFFKEQARQLLEKLTSKSASSSSLTRK